MRDGDREYYQGIDEFPLREELFGQPRTKTYQQLSRAGRRLNKAQWKQNVENRMKLKSRTGQGRTPRYKNELNGRTKIG